MYKRQTWNYGTEKDEEFKYHNGNDKPQGFGHICKFENGRCEGCLLYTSDAADDQINV